MQFVAGAITTIVLAFILRFEPSVVVESEAEAVFSAAYNAGYSDANKVVRKLFRIGGEDRLYEMNI